MKKTRILLITMIIMISLTLLNASGRRGERAAEGMVLSINTLDQIETGSSWELIIEEGSAGELRIDSARNSSWVDYSGGTLKFGENPRIGINLKKNKATLIVPALSASLSASSSSDIMVFMDLESKNFKLRASSSGHITLKEISVSHAVIRSSSSGRINIERISADNLDVDLSSSGKLIVNRGAVKNLITELSSSSRMEAEELLITESLSVKGSSSSKQEYSIADNTELRGSLSSSANVILYGNPSARDIQEIRTSSSGRVQIR